MHSEHLKRQQRRAAERAAAKAGRQAPFRAGRVPSDATTRADETYHLRFPARTIRMRPASRTEVERMEAQRVPEAHGLMPAGWRWFALVMYGAHGPIARHFVEAPSGTDCDLSQAEALAWWRGGAWPKGQLDADIALQHSLAHAGPCLRIRMPIGPEGYPDTAAAAVGAYALAHEVGLPPPSVVEGRSDVQAVWPICGAAFAAFDAARLYAMQAVGIEIVASTAVLADVMPSNMRGGAA